MELRANEGQLGRAQRQAFVASCPPYTGACPLPSQGLQPRDQVSRAPTPRGLIQRAQSRRLGQPRRGTQELGVGEDVRGPRHSSCVPAPRAALGGGSWHPLALDTANLGWRKQRPAPAWPEGAVFPEQLPTSKGRLGPAPSGRPTALPSTPPEQLCQKTPPDLGMGARAPSSALDLFSH